jgi:hypothetical protein
MHDVKVHSRAFVLQLHKTRHFFEIFDKVTHYVNRHLAGHERFPNTQRLDRPRWIWALKCYRSRKWKYESLAVMMQSSLEPPLLEQKHSEWSRRARRFSTAKWEVWFKRAGQSQSCPSPPMIVVEVRKPGDHIDLRKSFFNGQDRGARFSLSSGWHRLEERIAQLWGKQLVNLRINGYLMVGNISAALVSRLFMNRKREVFEALSDKTETPFLFPPPFALSTAFFFIGPVIILRKRRRAVVQKTVTDKI